MNYKFMLWTLQVRRVMMKYSLLLISWLSVANLYKVHIKRPKKQKKKMSQLKQKCFMNIRWLSTICWVNPDNKKNLNQINFNIMNQSLLTLVRSTSTKLFLKTFQQGSAPKRKRVRLYRSWKVVLLGLLKNFFFSCLGPHIKSVWIDSNWANWWPGALLRQKDCFRNTAKYSKDKPTMLHNLD